MNEIQFTPRYTTEQRVPPKCGKKGKSFVVISLVHTVTDFMIKLLRSNPEILMHGELFSDIEAEACHPSHLASWTMDTRDESPLSFLQYMLANPDKYVGFLSRPSQWENRQDVLKEIVHDPTIKKIVLTGDPLRSFAAFCDKVQRGELFSPEVTISPNGIQRFIDDVKNAEESYKNLLPPSKVLWINHEEFFHDWQRASANVFNHIGVPLAEPALSHMLGLAFLEREFCPVTFLKRHSTERVYDMVRYCFNLEDVDIVEEMSVSCASSDIDKPENPLQAKNSLKWALLVAIKSTDGIYEWDRLETFSQTLIRSLSAESLERLIVHFGIDEDDVMRTVLSTEVSDVLTGIKCKNTILKFKKGEVCKLWNKLASVAVKDGCDFFVFLGDDITFESYNWMSSIERRFEEISTSTKQKYGVGCVAFNDLGFPNFPTFPVLHRSHFEVFGEVFNSRFINQGGDPYLFELYNRLGAAVIDSAAKIRNHIGGNSTSQSRYEKRTIRFKSAILSRSLDVLRKEYGDASVLPSLDVVVPTYRLKLDILDTIIRLRVSRQCQVKFWIVVDNPEHPSLSELQERYDGKSEDGNYRIQVLVHPQNLGASAARNTGMMRSCADWIVLFDDDVHPQETILDQYLAATFRYPDADAFAGVTVLPEPVSWWQEALALSGVTYFYQIASRMTHVPWNVTANLCVKGRTNEGVMFQLYYPNSGGGEDIDFCFRLKKDAKGIVSVPNAVAHHQWFGSGALEAFMHVVKWVIGDSLLVEVLPQHTFSVFPGWTEFILLASLPAIACSIFFKILIMVVCMEIAFKSLLFFIESWRDSSKRKPTLVAAIFASLVLMGQELIKTACHIKRNSPQALCRRMDWFDGMNQKATDLSKRQHVVKFGLYTALFCYLALM